MRKINYIIMAVSAFIFSVFWLLLCNVVDFFNNTNEWTMIIVFAIVAITITLLSFLKFIKQKDVNTSRKAIRFILTALSLLALMIGVFYLAIVILLSFGH